VGRFFRARFAPETPNKKGRRMEEVRMSRKRRPQGRQSSLYPPIGGPGQRSSLPGSRKDGEHQPRRFADAASPAGAPAPTPAACAPDVNVAEWLELYAKKHYSPLAGAMLATLAHYDSVSFAQISPEDLARLEAFATTFFYLFTRPDFEIPENISLTFVAMGHVLANVAAMSSFGTTDGPLTSVMRQSKNLVKLLTLYNARNRVTLDPKELFDLSPKVASLWYTRYPLCMGGFTSVRTTENVTRHLASVDPRFVIPDEAVTAMYFGCTDLDPENDRVLKQAINARIRKDMRRVPVENHPRPGHVAVLTSKWFPGSAVYRSSFPFIQALAQRYELTLVHLGAARPDLDTSLFRRVLSVQLCGAQLDMNSVVQNDFQAAYYPDIGMSPESVWLSNVRLAPVQAMGYGHPVSTFGSEIDYFIGGGDVELAHLAEHNYSERLVLIPGIGSHPVYPDYQFQRPPRRDDAIRINCSWGCAKITYPLLAKLKEIRDRASRPVIFQFFPSWGLERYNCVLPFLHDIQELLSSSAFVVTNHAYQQYMQYMEWADLALDSYPFGGYNTVVDSLFLGKPLVAQEGTHYYNRVSSAVLRRCGLGELVAEDDRQYVEKTLRLIDDQEYRQYFAGLLSTIDLRSRLFDTEEPRYFARAIEYVIDNHQRLKQDGSRAPICISPNDAAAGPPPPVFSILTAPPAGPWPCGEPVVATY
jgi:hypothetical protein